MRQFYSKQVTTTLIIVLFSITMFAQQSQGLWSKTTKGITLKDNQVLRNSEPNKAGFYQLDLDRLKVRLANAPLRGTSSKPSNVIIRFPNAEGGLESFRVMEAPVMVPEFQAKHPDMRAYVGQGIDNPTSIVRFSVTLLGLHAMILSSKQGTQYIDPYSKNGNNYIVYAKRDLPVLDEKFVCGVLADERLSGRSELNTKILRNANDGMLREFKLALACTAEYGNYHGGTEVAIKAAMMITMTRVNGIYERDLSITMNMVENASIIYFGDVDLDPYTSASTNAMLDENQAEIDTQIGETNYDIGHVFNKSDSGDGLAGFGVVCVWASSPPQARQKAKGVTGFANPVGDAFDVDYVSHEMGHQFGANHTFNGDNASGNCSGGNRNGSTAYEPGSGSTIMAYAGICSPVNVQPNSDAYFHQKSLEEIWTFVNGTGNCAMQSSTGNNSPTAIIPVNAYTIPVSTPYKLIGSSSDVEATATHTYTWEQWDIGSIGAPTEATATGPLVRSFEGTDNPARYIPRLADLRYSNGGSTTWEKLSNLDNRIINFKLTVRDNDVNGGQTDDEDMTITTNDTAGPFLVTSQNTSGVEYPSSSTQTITWDRANTDIAPFNEATVNIWLSTDGGLTYPTNLAMGTANDGTEDVMMPAIQAPFCRVMVEAANNIFFNVNDEDFAIGVTINTTCDQFAASPSVAIDDDGGAFQTEGILSTTSKTFGTDVFLKMNLDVTHTYIQDLRFDVLSPDGTQITIIDQPCGDFDDMNLIFFDGASSIVCAEPTIGNVSPNDSFSSFDGETTAGVWTLGFVDQFAGDTGTLNSWYVEICETTITPLSIDEFDLGNFSIFPNPNTGEFTLKLKSVSDKLDVEVYDLRGRSIFYNVYESNSNFNRTINLNHAQSGMYLVKISDGERSATKKIIVK